MTTEQPESSLKNEPALFLEALRQKGAGKGLQGARGAFRIAH
jgi:hypothetical protein